MWVTERALERIRELEAQVRESVPKNVYDSLLARIAEQERRIDWQSDMLLRASQSLPLPPAREKAKPEPEPRISDGDREKARVVIEQGKALGLPTQEIIEAVQRTVGNWTEADVAAAINAPNNGHG